METVTRIPFSKEAEAYVLGSIMIDGALANEFCSNLSEDDFYIDVNKKVYRAIDNLYRQKEIVDVSKVIEELKKLKLHDAIGGNVYLMELIDGVPSVINTYAYVDIIKEKSLERALYYKCQSISKDVIDGQKSLNDLFATTENDIMAIINRRRTSELKPIHQATEEIMNLIETNKDEEGSEVGGIDTGYEDLNKYTFGFQKGELIILAARPGVGKSAFALNMAVNACSSEKHSYVSFFSLEMGMDQLVMRLLSAASNVKLEKIRKGTTNDNEMRKILSAKKNLDALNLYLDESTTTNIEDIKVKCRKKKREGKLDFIIIDYLQLLTVSSGKQKMSRYEEVTSLSRNLKLLARELNVPILALSQLSRNVEQRSEAEGNEPRLSDLRESGSIEQDADIVIFLHRARTKDVETEYKNARTKVIIAKNRQGMTGDFNLVFRGECSIFIHSK